MQSCLQSKPELQQADALPGGYVVQVPQKVCGKSPNVRPSRPLQLSLIYSLPCNVSLWSSRWVPCNHKRVWRQTLDIDREYIADPLARAGHDRTERAAVLQIS
eukprot:365942-Chlamydomonas_euryale.AAC.37